MQHAGQPRQSPHSSPDPATAPHKTSLWGLMLQAAQHGLQQASALDPALYQGFSLTQQLQGQPPQQPGGQAQALDAQNRVRSASARLDNPRSSAAGDSAMGSDGSGVLRLACGP